MAASTTKSFKHLNDSQWSTFCGGKLKFFETKWTKKLEEYTEEDHRENEMHDDDVDVIMHEGSSDDEDIQLNHYDAEQ